MSAARPRLLPSETTTPERIAVLESETEGMKDTLNRLQDQFRSMELRMYTFNGIFLAVFWAANKFL